VAKNVIATGASQNDRLDFFLYADGLDAMADFSSRGTCEDWAHQSRTLWRREPGSLRSDSQLPTMNLPWAPILTEYMYEGGTSQAGPHVSERPPFSCSITGSKTPTARRRQPW